MPVEIEGETIWVECVPGGAGERQVGIDFSAFPECFEFLCNHFLKWYLAGLCWHIDIHDFHDTIILQDGGDGAIVLNMEDHEEIPKAVVKPP